MTATADTLAFATLVRQFFCQRLIAQQNASARTVASYRDTFRLLLAFFAESRGRPRRPSASRTWTPRRSWPSWTTWSRCAATVSAPGTLRLAALRSFLKFAAARDPTCLPAVQRALAIPMKRFGRPLLGYLSREEMAAILAAPDGSTWSGQRDRVLFALMYNTGARVSEAIGLRRSDVELAPSRTARIEGKGRKQRVIPLWPSTAARLREWLPRIGPDPGSPLFPNAHGGPLSRSGVEDRLREAVGLAVASCPDPGRPADLAAYAAAYDGDAPPAVGGRHHGDRPVAGARGHGDDAPVRRGGPGDEGAALSRIEELPSLPLRYRAGDELLRFLDGL